LNRSSARWVIDHDAQPVAHHDASLGGAVERRQLDAARQDVKPQILLGPVGERAGADCTEPGRAFGVTVCGAPMPSICDLILVLRD